MEKSENSTWGMFSHVQNVARSFLPSDFSFTNRTSACLAAERSGKPAYQSEYDIRLQPVITYIPSALLDSVLTTSCLSSSTESNSAIILTMRSVIIGVGRIVVYTLRAPAVFVLPAPIELFSNGPWSAATRAEELLLGEVNGIFRMSGVRDVLSHGVYTEPVLWRAVS